MPSDVIGGILVATLWMALAVAALRVVRTRAAAEAPAARELAAPRSAPGAVRPGVPERLAALAGLVGGAAEDEQQVGEAVQVAHGLRVGVLDGDRAPLGAAADRAADVQRAPAGVPPGITNERSGGSFALTSSQACSSQAV